MKYCASLQVPAVCLSYISGGFTPCFFEDNVLLNFHSGFFKECKLVARGRHRSCCCRAGCRKTLKLQCKP